LNIIKKISFSKNKEEGIFAKSIKNLTGYKPKDISLYKIAFTHKSANITDEKGIRVNYERLEFLGDALLDASITSFLFHNLKGGSSNSVTFNL